MTQRAPLLAQPLAEGLHSQTRVPGGRGPGPRASTRCRGATDPGACALRMDLGTRSDTAGSEWVELGPRIAAHAPCATHHAPRITHHAPRTTIPALVLPDCGATAPRAPDEHRNFIHPLSEGSGYRGLTSSPRTVLSLGKAWQRSAHVPAREPTTTRTSSQAWARHGSAGELDPGEARRERVRPGPLGPLRVGAWERSN